MRNLVLAILATAVFSFAANDAQAQGYSYGKGRSSFSSGFGGSRYYGRSLSSSRGFSNFGYSGRSSFGSPYSGRSYSPYRSYSRSYGGSRRGGFGFY